VTMNQVMPEQELGGGGEKPAERNDLLRDQGSLREAFAQRRPGNVFKAVTTNRVAGRYVDGGKKSGLQAVGLGDLGAEKGTELLVMARIAGGELQHALFAVPEALREPDTGIRV